MNREGAAVRIVIPTSSGLLRLSESGFVESPTVHELLAQYPVLSTNLSLVGQMKTQHWVLGSLDRNGLHVWGLRIATFSYKEV